MAKLPDVLAPLAALNSARKNAAEYYAPLLASPDPILQLGAWCALLDRGEVSYAQYPAVLAMADNPAIRDRAYRSFLKFFDYGPAEQVAATETNRLDEAERRAMAAELNGDPEQRAASLRELYLVTGRTDVLSDLVAVEDGRGGWRLALPVAIELVVLNPHDPILAFDLLEHVHESRQVELLDAVVELFEANSLHPHATMLYSAGAKLLKGNPGGCLKTLATLAEARIARPDLANRLRSTAYFLSAQAMEKLGDYRKAYAAYRDMKAVPQGRPISLDEFPAMVTSSAKLDIPALPADAHTNHFIMTGFPRSGTTLLENALAAHPRIETFEEIPSGSSTHIYLDRVLPTLGPGVDRTAIFAAARERYYAEAERRHRKASAEIFVDKMPIRSAEAAFMRKLFPDKRYIFSIRHPRDVVLSCIRQRFSPNVAMEHFRSFETAVKLYDFTMTQWFGVFGLDDPRVHYVRYDTLVTEFEATMRSVLSFLGTEWDDAVHGFAEAADTRATKTPSYHKVRQGLGIGVQTAWRNYAFLFQSDAARPLQRWVEFFGYHVG
jgi:hypothetical protein